MEDLINEINKFKKDIDPELAHLEIAEFIDAVALTPGERKSAELFLKKLKDKI